MLAGNNSPETHKSAPVSDATMAGNGWHAARRPQIELIFFDAGSGHRASASALKTVLESERSHWQVRMFNLREALGGTDLVQRLTRIRIEDFYNAMLKRGITIGTGPTLRMTQLLIRAMRSRQVACMAHHWRDAAPDLVASLVPNFNRPIFEGLRAADRAAKRPPSPFVTIMTDLADYPPHFWMERQNQYLICGTDAAVRQALAVGYEPLRVFRTSGMILNPEFYQSIDINRELERRRIGLDPELPAGIVMFGGFGSRRMVAIARYVAAAGVKMQLIFVCGHNRRLGETIRAMRLPFPHHVEDFTRQIPRFMRLADFFIGKPGPGSISEALVMGLPVIVERNAWTMVQERFNTDWIAENGLGLVMRSFSEIGSAIAPMLHPQTLAEFRARVAALKNRAVFEIPTIFDSLLAREQAKALADSP